MMLGALDNIRYPDISSDDVSRVLRLYSPEERPKNCARVRHRRIIDPRVVRFIFVLIVFAECLAAVLLIAGAIALTEQLLGRWHGGVPLLLSRASALAFTCVWNGMRTRPICVWTEDHVRENVFLHLLALHVEWHMRRRLAPTLFEKDDREAAPAQRGTPVGKARPSESARRKAAAKRTAGGLPAHGFRTLLDDLSSMALNQRRLPGHGEGLLSVVMAPSPVQQRAFEFLGVKPDRDVPIRSAGPTATAGPENS